MKSSQISRNRHDYDAHRQIDGGAAMPHGNSALRSGLDHELERARHVEHEARGAFIKSALARTVDVASLDRIRLAWVQAGDELDKLLASRGMVQALDRAG